MRAEAVRARRPFWIRTLRRCGLDDSEDRFGIFEHGRLLEHRRFLDGGAGVRRCLAVAARRYPSPLTPLPQGRGDCGWGAWAVARARDFFWGAGLRAWRRGNCSRKARARERQTGGGRVGELARVGELGGSIRTGLYSARRFPFAAYLRSRSFVRRERRLWG